VAINTELEETNAKLKAQLSDWERDAHTRLIDPLLVDDSRWANRHKASFASVKFAELKREIASAGGNVQPIKVRLKPDGRFEPVFGHRRVQACKELGLPVLAVIAEGLTDAAMFAEMDRENRNREDLSPWEQGDMYRRALDEGLFPSNRRLADAVGIDLSNLGKCLALARLPAEVVEAFGSPLDIQLRWGGLLAKVQEADPAGLVKRAKSVLKMSPRPNAKAVLSLLLAEGQGGGSEPPPVDVAQVQIKRDGSAVVKLPAGSLSQGDVAELKEVIDSFVRSKTAI
jgi:ParB family chromosome partitioning protein